MVLFSASRAARFRLLNTNLRRQPLQFRLLATRLLKALFYGLTSINNIAFSVSMLLRLGASAVACLLVGKKSLLLLIYS